MQAFFEGQGFEFTDTDLLDAAVLAAVQRFEKRSGYKPFLAIAVAAAYTFDPPAYGSASLDLKGGFYTITQVKVRKGYGETGETLTEGRDYRLRPLNAQADYKPYTEIEFIVSPAGEPGSIEITGRRGYWHEIEEAAWLAVRGDAFAQIVHDIIEGESTASELTQGPIKVKYDNDDGRSKIDRFQKSALDTANQYKRIVI